MPPVEQAAATFPCSSSATAPTVSAASPLRAGWAVSAAPICSNSCWRLSVSSAVSDTLGTPWAWDAPGALLFLEEVGEEPYRVDRLLQQLRLAGVLAAAAGFVLGSFTEAADCEAVLADHLLPLGRPLLAGWPAGHGQPNRALPLGLPVRLDVGERQLRW